MSCEQVEKSVPKGPSAYLYEFYIDDIQKDRINEPLLRTRTTAGKGQVEILVHYHTWPGQSLAILGNSKDTGNWESSKAVIGHYIESGWWHVKFHTPKSDVQYKLVIINDNKDVLRWEERNNRNVSAKQSGCYVVAWNHNDMKVKNFTDCGNKEPSEKKVSKLSKYSSLPRGFKTLNPQRVSLQNLFKHKMSKDTSDIEDKRPGEDAATGKDAANTSTNDQSEENVDPELKKEEKSKLNQFMLRMKKSRTLDVVRRSKPEDSKSGSSGEKPGEEETKGKETKRIPSFLKKFHLKKREKSEEKTTEDKAEENGETSEVKEEAVIVTEAASENAEPKVESADEEQKDSNEKTAKKPNFFGKLKIKRSKSNAKKADVDESPIEAGDAAKVESEPIDNKEIEHNGDNEKTDPEKKDEEPAKPAENGDTPKKTDEEENEKPEDQDTTDNIPTTEIELKPKSPVKKRRKRGKINSSIKKAFGRVFPWKSAKTYDVSVKEGDNKSNVVEIDDEKSTKVEENGHVTVDLDDSNVEQAGEEKIEKEKLETEKPIDIDTEDKIDKQSNSDDELNRSKNISAIYHEDVDERTNSFVVVEDTTLEEKSSLDLLDKVIECQ